MHDQLIQLTLNLTTYKHRKKELDSPTFGFT